MSEISGEAPLGGRLDQAVAAFVRQQFGSPVAAIIGYLEILLEDASRVGLDDCLPDLALMRNAADEMLALIGRVVSGNTADMDPATLRHELRTPLSAIKGYGELLLEDAGVAPLAADLGQVLGLTGRLLGDIDRLVAFGSGGAGPGETPPVDIVRGVLQTIAPLDANAERPVRDLPSRILVVDDDPANRDLLSRRLIREGHSVALAENGAAGLELARDGSFDLVLLDLMMPGLSGFEVLSRLKAEAGTRDLPVIMISALDELDSTVRCIEAGAEDYLPKPFNPVLLRARIDASLEKKHLRDRERATAEALRAEKERSEALLLNILPSTIVERLRRGETVIADHIPDATILFSDLVDFSMLAARLPPEGIVALLGRLFAEFDALAARLGLEKIKTIGDGYMVAGGVPEARPDHAAAVAEMALAMREAASRSAAELNESLQLRIGLHSGPLVAGVIGTHKFVYDVWGDTVNTAKRMESHGAPGRIHVSAATRAMLGNDFRFEPRSAIAVKGKGEMETYFLEPAL